MRACLRQQKVIHTQTDYYLLFFCQSFLEIFQWPGSRDRVPQDTRTGGCVPPGLCPVLTGLATGSPRGTRTRGCVPLHLVDVVDAGQAVEAGVHGVEHVDDADGLTGGADVGEGDHVAEQDGAHLELP